MLKNKTIETLRSIAVISLIIIHVIGIGSLGGMRLSFPSFGRYVVLFIYTLVVPLYMAISGWAYACSSSYHKPLFTFAKDKFLRLMIPMIMVGTLYFIVQYFVPGTNVNRELSSIWRIYVFPFTIFWFLPSLFLLQLLQFGIDKLNMCNSKVRFLLLLFVAYLLRLMVSRDVFYDIPNVMAFHASLSLWFYFLLGVGVNRFTTNDIATKFRPFLSAGVLCWLILMNYVWFFDLTVMDQIPYQLIQPILVALVLVLLLTLKWQSSLLVRLSTYSYGIYLFHAFGTAGGRILLSYIGIHSEWIIFIVSFFLSLTSSVVVTWLLRRNRFTNFLFLGGHIVPKIQQ